MTRQCQKVLTKNLTLHWSVQKHKMSFCIHRLENPTHNICVRPTIFVPYSSVSWHIYMCCKQPYVSRAFTLELYIVHFWDLWKYLFEALPIISKYLDLGNLYTKKYPWKSYFDITFLMKCQNVCWKDLHHHLWKWHFITNIAKGTTDPKVATAGRENFFPGM